ncbi:ubiquinol oxidase subunit II [Paracoccus sp. 1_MG-2023]|uniref:ubiquinol oxidase subunit II n=1 Tax=unclassified Paracoccus (in: a-proteobacteria) TaxID=2688777 RepID=UPI001C088B98|nr:MULTISPECIES: ubiquinol oxidase subunit II [unclassified Paracoccus (in: a-proteobacteria)]MBU2956326.1 ubiquinol oxidase subunit II [Paracoccus sp. C2R09]MDO6668002.1 ubiquinol oxidase subunit II [Paracoccus sp. 1_MG-2023]
MRVWQKLAVLPALATVSACDLVVLDPSGDVAAQQGDLIVYSTILMLIVILPVMALTAYFAWHYRASNKKAKYDPEWDHSISLEVVVWMVPLAIIICLAGLTWVATHRLNPYDSLPRISAEKAIDPNVEPLVVEVVAMDWKWLFIYPEQGVAMVNEAAVVTDRPVEWRITSTTVMNSFYVPAMAGQIYAMAGMQTELNAVMNQDGTYKGFSANYSGNGFNYMNFDLHSFDEAGFDQWIETARSEGAMLDRETFVELEKPTIDHPVTAFDGIEEGLWERILNLCVSDDDLCVNDMMMVDALGGGGIEGLYNREAYRGICSVENPEALFEILRPTDGARAADILAALDMPLQSTPAEAPESGTRPSPTEAN